MTPSDLLCGERVRLTALTEGTFREFMQRDGRRYDMLLYGLLREEWAARE